MADPRVEIPELPRDESIDRLVALLEPFTRIAQPKLYGLGHLPSDGALLVGNHTIYGFLDLPFMMAEIWKHGRVAICGLGEHAHYAVPIWRDLLEVGGMVRGSRRGQADDPGWHPIPARRARPGPQARCLDPAAPAR